jgi:hypothetical protein
MRRSRLCLPSGVTSAPCSGKGADVFVCQVPPLVTVPPVEDETPEEDETPLDFEVPEVSEDFEEVPDVSEEFDDVPDVPDVADVAEDELSPDDVRALDAEVLVDSCEDAVVCANFAPIRVAAAAESRPADQVSFLTRRRPVSLARAAAATAGCVY